MKKIFLVLILNSLFLGGCSEPYNPFRIEKAEFFKKVKVIGMKPVRIKIDVPDAEKRKKEFEDNLQKKLEESGFTVIPASNYEEIHKTLKKTIGPMYDPYSGKISEEKLETLLEHTKQEYLKKYKVDAILIPGIIVVKALWNHNHAAWHGTEEASTGKEGFWAALSSPSAYGTLPALSLLVAIENVNKELYYLNYGGIQLCSWVSGHDFIDVPKNTLLSYEDKNSKSVDIAIEPLLKKLE
jgi:hypothetical protein